MSDPMEEMRTIVRQIPPGPWRRLEYHRREVICPNDDCEYFAQERWEVGAKTGSGICTKCGHYWTVEGEAP